MKNLNLGPLGFGGASVSGEGAGYGFGAMSEAEAEVLLKSSFERGIRLFDTAPIYGFGLSEERFGRYLPKQAFIVSKAGVDWHESKRVNMTNDPVVVERMLRESLNRLKREQIDLYMIHWPDSKVDIRKPLEVLKRFQDSSVIKYIGLCNTTQEDLLKAKEVIHVDVLQSEYNFFENKFSELPLSDYWSMSWGTLDKGILSGRVEQGRVFDRDDCRSWAPWWDKKKTEIKIKKVSILKLILNEIDRELLDFCLSYNLSYVDQALIGFKTISDLDRSLESLSKRLSRDEITSVLKKYETKCREAGLFS